MRPGSWPRIVGWGILGLCLILTLAVHGVEAQEGGGLEPSFGNGRLTITGDGFKAGEVVTVTMEVDGVRAERTVTADAQGHFELRTGIAVRAGASVSIEARGNQGTGMAAMTTVPALLPNSGSDWLPSLVTAALGAGLVGSGLVVRRQVSM